MNNNIKEIVEKDFVSLEDGFYYYEPHPEIGCLTEYDLRCIADLLEEKNKEYKKRIEEYFKQEEKQLRNIIK